MSSNASILWTFHILELLFYPKTYLALCNATFEKKITIFFLTFLFIGTIHSLSAQQLPSTVSFSSTMFGYKLHQGEIQIGRERMRGLMLNCEKPLEKFNTGNKVLSVSTLFQLVSLVCVAGYATDRYFNDKINNELLIAGGAVFLVGVGLNVSAKKQIGVSIGKYNINCAK